MSEWIARMESAAQEVFTSMLGVQVARSLIDSGAEGPDLTAIVGLAGAPTGVLGISCQEASAARIAARMLGSETPESKENAADALGEVCNMVAGSLKAGLSASEDLCRLSAPTIISGKDYHVRPILNGERHEVCLDFEGQPIKMILEIHRSPNGAGSPP